MSTFNRVFKDNERLATNPLTNNATFRTTFDRSHTNKTTFTSGQLIPIYFDEVLPADTHLIDFNYLIRMSTPLVPTLDNSVIDFHFFFVPNRLVWNKWKEFMGESPSSWVNNTTYRVPVVNFGRTSPGASNSYFYGTSQIPAGYKDNDLASYLGIPSYKNFFFTEVYNGEIYENNISALPFRAYAKIWNDWYRDQNVQDEIPLLDLNDVNIAFDLATVAASGFNPYDPGQAILGGLGTLPVSKLPDYFTTCLPSTQKGDPVNINIGEIPQQYLEVINRNQWIPRGTSTVKNNFNTDTYFRDSNVRYNHVYQFLMGNNSSSNVSQPNNSAFLPGYTALGSTSTATNLSAFETSNNTHLGGAAQRVSAVVGGGFASVTDTANLLSANNQLYYHDLVANLPTQNLGSVSINDLRLAFATQHFLETDARGGTRYIEIIRNHFGVISPDARLQRSEYIGGRRDYNNINQVLATTQSQNDQQFIGTTGAFSMTTGKNDRTILYSATEHGYIMGFVIIRPLHTYAQGLSKTWTRRGKFDFYWPEFANIGEQPVFKRELFLDNVTPASAGQFSEVFGYNEAWADYRYKKNQASGWFSPNSPNYLSAWTYTDNYNNAPTLNSQWMKENRGNIAQTLAMLEYDQFLIDLNFTVKTTRPMPAFSIPGLSRM